MQATTCQHEKKTHISRRRWLRADNKNHHTGRYAKLGPIVTFRSSLFRLTLGGSTAAPKHLSSSVWHAFPVPSFCRFVPQLLWVELGPNAAQKSKFPAAVSGIPVAHAFKDL
eukprot:5003199-Amphidinium_carterae.1